MVSKDDPAFAALLESSGNVEKFVDNVFGFLARRTDFFMDLSQNQKMGFPEGHAEAIVRSKFKYWQALVKKKCAEKPCEVQVKSDTHSDLDSQKSPPSNCGDNSSKPLIQKTRALSTRDVSNSSTDHEAYNGRTTEKYTWSQTIGEIDVTIPVSTEVKKGKQVSVKIESGFLKVEVPSENEPLINANLSHPVKKDDSYWNLLPGQCIKIFLQKGQERWWQALIEGEELLDMSKIESVKPMEDLPEEEQMKLQELCWNEERKRQGLPTSEEMKMENILKKAWDATGSPFKGQPFDPSIVEMAPGSHGIFPLPNDKE